MPRSWSAPHFDSDFVVFGLVFASSYLRFVRAVHQANSPQPAQRIVYHTPTPLDSTGRSLLDSLHHLARQENRPVCRPLLLAILQYALGFFKQAPTEPLGKGAHTYQIARQYIEENCHLPINRATVAQTLGLHPNHLSRLFQTYEKTSFQKTLTQLRMQRALGLLRDHQLDDAELARQCGFNDPHYFRRVFEKQTGAPLLLQRHAKLPHQRT